MEKGKTVVIGARGMLGSMLMTVLAPWQPFGLDRDEVDITDLDSIRAACGPLKPAVIINAAAYTNVDGAEGNRQAAFAVNELGVGNLATVARECPATLVHYSTDYVFPGDSPAGYTEDDTPGPAVNVYGASKLAGEEALAASGAAYYLIRTAWLYGPNGKNFVDTMVRLGSEKSVVRVVSDQIGSPTFTKDVALFTKQLFADQAPRGIYHAVNSGQASWYEFAREIFRLKKIIIPVQAITSSEYPLPAKRPAFSYLKNTKRPALRPWAQALMDYLQMV